MGWKETNVNEQVGKDVPVHSPSELSRRNVDLWELCDDGLALAAGSGAYLGVERSFRGQHDHEGGEHVALPRMASLPGTHRLAPAQVRFDEADERITPHGTVLMSGPASDVPRCRGCVP